MDSRLRYRNPNGLQNFTLLGQTSQPQRNIYSSASGTHRTGGGGGGPMYTMCEIPHNRQINTSTTSGHLLMNSQNLLTSTHFQFIPPTRHCSQSQQINFPTVNQQFNANKGFVATSSNFFTAEEIAQHGALSVSARMLPILTNIKSFFINLMKPKINSSQTSPSSPTTSTTPRLNAANLQTSQREYNSAPDIFREFNQTKDLKNNCDFLDVNDMKPQGIDNIAALSDSKKSFEYLNDLTSMNNEQNIIKNDYNMAPVIYNEEDDEDDSDVYVLCESSTEEPDNKMNEEISLPPPPPTTTTKTEITNDKIFNPTKDNLPDLCSDKKSLSTNTKQTIISREMRKRQRKTRNKKLQKYNNRKLNLPPPETSTAVPVSVTAAHHDDVVDGGSIEYNDIDTNLTNLSLNSTVNSNHDEVDHCSTTTVAIITPTIIQSSPTISPSKSRCILSRFWSTSPPKQSSPTRLHHQNHHHHNQHSKNKKEKYRHELAWNIHEDLVDESSDSIDSSEDDTNDGESDIINSQHNHNKKEQLVTNQKTETINKSSQKSFTIDDFPAISKSSLPPTLSLSPRLSATIQSAAAPTKQLTPIAESLSIPIPGTAKRQNCSWEIPYKSCKLRIPNRLKKLCDIRKNLFGSRQKTISECESEDSFIVFDSLPNIVGASAAGGGIHQESPQLSSLVESTSSSINNRFYRRERQISECSDDFICFENVDDGDDDDDDGDVNDETTDSDSDTSIEDESDDDSEEEDDEEYGNDTVLENLQLSDEDDDEEVDTLSVGTTQLDSGFEEKKQLKVSFDNSPPIVHVIHTWNYAYRQARKSIWEQIGRDRVRFRDRVNRLSLTLAPILDKEHRQKVYKQRFLTNTSDKINDENNDSGDDGDDATKNGSIGTIANYNDILLVQQKNKQNHTIN